MFVTLEGIVIDFRAEQKKKALRPMVVILSGRDTDFNPEPLNAWSAMPVTLNLLVTSGEGFNEYLGGTKVMTSFKSSFPWSSDKPFQDGTSRPDGAPILIALLSFANRAGGGLRQDLRLESLD